ncbi:MAG: hypothetical protein U1E53_29980 [Dongiaceae bacterium]
MATKIDKVIVTNLAALRAKYGAAGLARLQKAVNALVAADRGRGLVTQLVGLDDKTDMGRLSATPVTDPADARQNKTAIDAVYRGLAPDYLMLLGAVDVIPHQDLKNPLYTGGTGPEDDVDPLALGDLPYACEAAYSQAITSFLGPTRVVGRLPDVTGATDPAYLLGVLETCAGWTGRDRSAIAGYFAVTAQVWQASSRQSTANIFGSARDLQSVPPKGRPWPAARLRAPVHFFNCHGAKGSPQFFGQPASGAAQYPVALDSADLAGRIGEERSRPPNAATARSCTGCRRRAGRWGSATAIWRTRPTASSAARRSPTVPPPATARPTSSASISSVACWPAARWDAPRSRPASASCRRPRRSTRPSSRPWPSSASSAIPRSPR